MITVFSDDVTEQIVYTGRQYLNISTLFYIFLGQIFIFRNTLQGMGQSAIPLIAGFTELLMRSFAAIWLAGHIGYLGVCWASPIAWFGAAVVVSVGYFVTIRKMNRRYLRNNLRMAAHKIGLLKPEKERRFLPLPNNKKPLARGVFCYSRAGLPILPFAQPSVSRKPRTRVHIPAACSEE